MLEAARLKLEKAEETAAALTAVTKIQRRFRQQKAGKEGKQLLASLVEAARAREVVATEAAIAKEEAMRWLKKSQKQEQEAVAAAVAAQSEHVRSQPQPPPCCLLRGRLLRHSSHHVSHPAAT